MNNKPMYEVVSTRKIKTMTGAINVAAHNLRQRINKTLKEAIDINLSHKNVYEGVKDYNEFNKIYTEIIANAHLKRNIQRNASRIIEFTYSFSPEYSEGWQNNNDLKEKIDNFFLDCKNFMTKKYGNVIISSAIHFDETTPHIHIMCIPFIISKDGKEVKFSSSEFLGGIKGMINLHTDFHNEVGKKYGLTRGEQGSRAKHSDLKQYKAFEKKKLQQMDDLNNKLKEDLEKIDNEKKDLKIKKDEVEFSKSRIQSIQNDLMKRGVEFYNKEQKLIAIQKDIPAYAPEIPLPPVNFIKTSREKWRENVKKIVDNSFNKILTAYQQVKYKYDKLLEFVKEITNSNKILKNRAETAENALLSMPISDILANRENKKKKDIKMNNETNKENGGVKLS